MMKIIFLDIDGVLLPFPNNDESSYGGALFPRSTVEALMYLMKEAEGCQLVLSSTWRVRPDFIEDILNCLRGYGIEIDSFYDITDPAFHNERQWEIAKWISDHKDLGENLMWIALDDENLLDGEANERYKDQFQGRVVQTKSDIGLTMEDARKAVDIMNIQQQQQMMTTKILSRNKR